MEAAPKATSRHTQPPLPLLPSGPGGVRSLALREDLRGHHNGTLDYQVSVLRLMWWLRPDLNRGPHHYE